jgi:hypothetical protein
MLDEPWRRCSSSRGQPQRSMMLAHYLWERTPRKAQADEETWVAALDQARPMPRRDEGDLARPDHQ